MPVKTAIAVFCYKRAAKLKQAMEALLKNPECSEMEIVFFCDGAKSLHDQPAVDATREYIEQVTGFKKVEKHFRATNLSTGPNFKQGLTYMHTHYDQFIVVEDDLVVTRNYIKYMLDALEFYRNDAAIFCVSGFAFPLKVGQYQFDTLVHTRFCSYGWATWSNRIRKVKWANDRLSWLITNSPGFKNRLNKEGLDLYRMLKKQLNGNISTWDIQMQVHVAENRLRVIYPVISKSHNIGFDNESTNTFGIDFLKTITDPGEKRNFSFCESGLLVSALQQQLRRPYSLPALATRKIANTLIKLTNSVKKAPNS